MTNELHVLAYRNTFLTTSEGKYVLSHLLTRLNYFDKCENAADMELRNIAVELLEDLGILFISNADTQHAETSIGNYVDAISKLDVLPLVRDQEEEQKKDDIF